MFDGNRVLLVLDDVDDKEQLTALAGHINWFSEGSRIIITTRNIKALDRHVVNEFFEVRELYESEALELFSYRALGRPKPTNEYLKLSKQIVSLTGNLPLALEVFGSFLFYKRKVEDWEVALEDLQKIRPQDLQDILKLSYDGLHEEEKCVFLDIACLFVQVRIKRGEAIDILKGCGFRAENAISILTERSLVKIKEDSTFWVHDQVRDMGRQIVIEESGVPLGMHSRMWDHNEIMEGLKNNKIGTNVRGIVLDFGKKKVVHSSGDLWGSLLRLPCLSSVLLFLIERCNIHILPFQYRVLNKEENEILSTKPFESMVNLRLLQINYARLEGKFNNFPAELKWLKWKGCPLKMLPSDYFPRQLAVLDLSDSGIGQVWSRGKKKVFNNLKVLNLQYCYNLVDIPDLSQCRTLEKVNLEHCIRLTKLHKSIGDVKTLLQLNLKRCSNLIELPGDVSGLKHLQSLHLSDCSKLTELPKDLGSMVSLKELLLDGTAISELPESVYCLTKLDKLSLNRCDRLRRLPVCIGTLTSLKVLSVDQTPLEELPDSIGSLSQLEELSLMWCEFITKIPESVSNLHMLTELTLHGSAAVTELPASIGSLSYLRVLSAGGCRSLKTLPDSVGGLACLTELQLDNTLISQLPYEVGTLKMVKNLYMRNCKSLRLLPEAMGSMLSLNKINLVGSNIEELPESIGSLEDLVWLRLNKCKKLQKLPASIGNLKSLHILEMEHTVVAELPDSFGTLSGLMVLKMRKSLSETSFEDNSVLLPSSFSNLTLLEELDARAWRICGKIPDDFEKLSLLESLDLGHNNFHSLPSSLRGLSVLKTLFLLNCENLIHLPPLPSSLEKLDLRNCTALESVSDVSNLEKLMILNTTNCKKVVDIPGIECLKSLNYLYMSGCTECSSAVKRRLSKVCLRNMYNLSIPGGEIPNWFGPNKVRFSERRNREIRAVIICVVVSVEIEDPEDLRYESPVLPDIEAEIHDENRSILNTTLNLEGIPKTNSDHIHLCRYSHHRPLVSMLKEGCTIEVRRKIAAFIEGVQLKKCGIHLVYENDDDYEPDEHLLNETQKSISEKLATFFNSLQDD